MSKPTQLYEINTAVYLARLSRDAGRQLTLAEIPDEALSDLTTRGIDAVWLMGVWQRSPRAIEIACADEQLMAEMHSVLPDMTNDDLIGSAYSIHDYIVDERFGGESALITFCEQLKRHGLRLILDFVPNHTALDHPWIQMHPDYYIHGSPADLAAHPRVICCGATSTSSPTAATPTTQPGKIPRRSMPTRLVIARLRSIRCVASRSSVTVSAATWRCS
jgi:hypothetical protein